jgi:hypothetical protein
VFDSIEGLKEPGDALGGYLELELVPVEAEWTACRVTAVRDTQLPDVLEAEKYQAMMAKVTSRPPCSSSTAAGTA